MTDDPTIEAWRKIAMREDGQPVLSINRVALRQMFEALDGRITTLTDDVARLTHDRDVALGSLMQTAREERELIRPIRIGARVRYWSWPPGVWVTVTSMDETHFEGKFPDGSEEAWELLGDWQPYDPPTEIEQLRAENERLHTELAEVTAEVQRRRRGEPK